MCIPLAAEMRTAKSRIPKSWIDQNLVHVEWLKKGMLLYHTRDNLFKPWANNKPWFSYTWFSVVANSDHAPGGNVLYTYKLKEDLFALRIASPTWFYGQLATEVKAYCDHHGLTLASYKQQRDYLQAPFLLEGLKYDALSIPYCPSSDEDEQDPELDREWFDSHTEVILSSRAYSKLEFLGTCFLINDDDDDDEAKIRVENASDYEHRISIHFTFIPEVHRSVVLNFSLEQENSVPNSRMDRVKKRKHYAFNSDGKSGVKPTWAHVVEKKGKKKGFACDADAQKWAAGRLGASYYATKGVGVYSTLEEAKSAAPDGATPEGFFCEADAKRHAFGLPKWKKDTGRNFPFYAVANGRKIGTFSF